MTTNDDTRNKRAAATFISKYYHLLMTDATKLVVMYMPKATFSHSHTGSGGSGVSGNSNIAESLKQLYVDGKTGRVAISSMTLRHTEDATATNTNRFVVIVAGSLFRKGASVEGEDFRHVVELQEHGSPNSNVFGIVADSLRLTANTSPAPPAPHAAPTAPPKLWAAETPPMFAKSGVEEVMPPLSQPAAAKAVTPPTKPQTASKLAVPDVPAVAPAATKEADEEAKKAPKKEESKTTGNNSKKQQGQETTATAAAAPAEKPAAAAAEPLSFADMIRIKAQGGGSPVTATPGASKVVASTTTTSSKKKEQTDEKTAAGKDEKKAAAKKSDTKQQKKDEDGKSAGAAPKKDQQGKGSSSDNKSANVVFYDIFVKGLPATATEEDVTALVGPHANIKTLKLESQPDKKDTSITRTFAFIQFDRKGQSATMDVSAVVKKIRQGGETKVKGTSVFIEEVREKFTPADEMSNKKNAGDKKKAPAATASKADKKEVKK